MRGKGREVSEGRRNRINSNTSKYDQHDAAWIYTSVYVCQIIAIEVHTSNMLWVYRGFPTRTQYLYYISCLRYTILVGNPQYTSVYVCQIIATEVHTSNMLWVYRGFPTRTQYLYYISCLRYTIVVGNPRYTSVYVCQIIATEVHTSNMLWVYTSVSVKSTTAVHTSNKMWGYTSVYVCQINNSSTYQQQDVGIYKCVCLSNQQQQYIPATCCGDIYKCVCLSNQQQKYIPATCCGDIQVCMSVKSQQYNNTGFFSKGESFDKGSVFKLSIANSAVGNLFSNDCEGRRRQCQSRWYIQVCIMKGQGTLKGQHWLHSHRGQTWVQGHLNIQQSNSLAKGTDTAGQKF